MIAADYNIAKDNRELQQRERPVFWWLNYNIAKDNRELQRKLQWSELLHNYNIAKDNRELQPYARVVTSEPIIT